MAFNPDRVRVLEVADRRPMADVFDKDFEGPVVDLGIDLDRFFGHVFIKSFHFEYIAREHLHMVSEEEHRAVMRQTAEVREELLEVYEELNALKAERQETFDAKLTEFLANYSNPINHVAGSVSPVAIDDAKHGALQAVKPETKAKGNGSEGNLNGL